MSGQQVAGLVLGYTGNSQVPESVAEGVEPGVTRWAWPLSLG